MIKSQFLDNEELFQKGIHILMQKLGPVETSRFLSLSTRKRMESVKRHRAWQKGLDKNKFFKDLFR